MAIPPINPVEINRLAKKIAYSKDKKTTVAELLGEPGSDKRKQLDPTFVKAVLHKVKKIIKRESDQPTLHPIKDWGFVQIIKGIQNRIEEPSKTSLESADLALKRELEQMHLEDYVDVCRSAQDLLQMYEYALPFEIKGKRDPANPICSEGTKNYFYKKLKEKHDELSYLELDIDAIATKSSLAVFMLTENEELVSYSFHLPDLELDTVTNIFSGLTYPKKRDFVTAYFMNPGTSSSELYPLIKSLFAISNGLDKVVQSEQVIDNTKDKTIKEPEHVGQDDLPQDFVRYIIDGELIEDVIEFENTTESKTNDITTIDSTQELLFKQSAEEVNNITQYIGRLLYTQALTFPDKIDTLINSDLDDEDEFGGIHLIDESSGTPFVSNQYTKQYILDRQEILIAGIEEHIFDISFENKLKLFPKLSGDEHRLRLACILTNEVESESEIAKVEKVFLNEIDNEDLIDNTGFRAANSVECYALLKRADAVDKLIDFLDHEDHLVRYQAFKKLCDQDVTGVPGENALVEKIEKDIQSGNPSWALSALCKYSSNQYSSEIGNQDKYKAILIRVLMLKKINIKDAFKKLDGLEVPFTLNLGDPSPGDIEPLSLLEVIDYIGVPELVDITLNSPQKNVRDNARKILEVLLEEDPHSLDDFMKTDELADSLRKAAGIAHASSIQYRKKDN